MEGIYENVQRHDKTSKPSTSRTGARRFHGGVIICLGLLSVFLVAGLIGLGVHYHYSALRSAEELSTMKEEFANRLLDYAHNLSVVTEERELLNASLVELTKELDRIQTLNRQRNKTCSVGWRLFSDSCYFLSDMQGSWTRGRQDCRDRGADLVVIESANEQKFLSRYTNQETWTWIGLIEGETEGSWRWVDGTSLNVRYWETDQPDNGGGHEQWGDEDCAHMRTGKGTEMNWNDLSCDSSRRWICEKMAWCIV